MTENNSQQIIDSNQVHFLPGGDALWAQYKLEMLLYASKKFLNELFTTKEGESIENLVNEFCRAIDDAQKTVDQHEPVSSVIEKLKTSE